MNSQAVVLEVAEHDFALEEKVQIYQNRQEAFNNILSTLLPQEWL